MCLPLSMKGQTMSHYKKNNMCNKWLDALHHGYKHYSFIVVKGNLIQYIPEID